MNTGTVAGSAASVSYLYGTSTSTISWPSGSIPSTYTICSLTSYVPNKFQGRILVANSTNENWLHGHWNACAGVHFENNNWLTTTNISITPKTNWVIMCAKNSLSSSSSILTNGYPAAITSATPKTTVLSLGVNNGPYTESSEFYLSQVMIWDKYLTDASMAYVSNLMQNYLNTGTMVVPWVPWSSSSVMYRTSSDLNLAITPTLTNSSYDPYIFKLINSSSVSGKYKINNLDIFTLVVDTSYSSDFGGINENQSNTGYKVSGADISSYSIAPYVDSVNYPNGIAQTNLPTWCKYIRVIMIGKGGSGSNANNVHIPANQQDVRDNHDHYRAQQGNHQQYHNHDHNKYNGNDNCYHEDYQQQNEQTTHTRFNENGRIQSLIAGQQNTNTQHNYHSHGPSVNQDIKGGGGGGGGFVYISSLSTNTYSQFQLSYAQTAVKLQLNNNAASVSVLDGGSAQQQNAGSGGLVQNQNVQIISNNGQAGTQGTQGTSGGNSGIVGQQYSTSLPYGKGGAGGSQNNNGGASGQGYYYRVYFLTG